jgi:quercetin dioxygenase-like cupin family protein
MKNNLVLLEQLTAKIIETPHEIRCDTCSRGYVEYDIPGGPAKAWGLLNGEEVSALDLIVPAGASFTTHIHLVKEWLIIYKGSGVFLLNGDTFPIKAGDQLIVDAEIEHGIILAETDLHIVVVAHGKAEGFPDVERPR